MNHLARYFAAFLLLTISVVAEKRGGVWRYDQLEVQFAGTPPIELRTAPELAAPVDARVPMVDSEPEE